jgi:hypothetical protein
LLGFDLDGLLFRLRIAVKTKWMWPRRPLAWWQGATEAQKEAVLSDEKLAHDRPSCLPGRGHRSGENPFFSRSITHPLPSSPSESAKGGAE